MSRREPIFNVPAPVLVLLAMLAAVHAGRGLLDEESDAWLTLALAFIPARYTGAADQLPGGIASAFHTPVSHLLVHADITHLALNSVWLLVFGAIVGRRLGTVRLLIFMAATAALGAGTFALVHWGAMLPMVGASGAISGLTGGAIRLLHAILRVGGVRDPGTAANYVPLPGLVETLTSRQVMMITGVILVTNLGLGATGSVLTPGSGGIAWEAHIGGFLAGLLGFGLIDPGPRPLPLWMQPDRPAPGPTGPAI